LFIYVFLSIILHCVVPTEINNISTLTCEECRMALVILYALNDVLPSGGLNTNRRLMVPSSGKRTKVALTAFLQHLTLYRNKTRQQRHTYL